MRAEPQRPLAVLDQFQVIKGFGFGIRFIRCEALSRRIETIQTIPGGRPERTIMVNEQTRDNVVAQTVRIGWVVPISPELPRPRVEAEEPLIIGADPDVA